ncbi:Crossover junction endodeoxyribonuclease RuvC [hydrothermal vent metagenome]|uniref:Crossover junction endodeoxyribonuclease RuvC n=1 Tax=hydrothermal vent metagenome TaxID=652676 RepID=A0A3B0T5J0_9ZZZZ
MTRQICLIGIDPGLRRTGWGVIVVEGSQVSHVAHGVVSPATDLPFATRLLTLYEALLDLARRHRAQEAAVEDTFVNKDPAASLKLGHARGAALLAMASAGLEVAEYAPNRVKKSVVGSGHADKRQIKAMVEMLLGRPGVKNADAADALAVAITHAHHRTQAAVLAAVS